MILLTRNITILFVVLLLNPFTVAGHSISGTMPHDMGGMKHTSSELTDVPSCVVICRTAVVKNEDKDFEGQEGQDYWVGLLGYQQNKILDLTNTYHQQKLYHARVKLPSKVPIYIIDSVFRA